MKLEVFELTAPTGWCSRSQIHVAFAFHSIRKERKVKPGFTPVEDVTRFRSARQVDAERRKLPPGSIVGYTKPSEAVEAARAGMSKSQKKNAKRKEARAGGGAEAEDTPDAWDDEPDAESPAQRNGTTTAKAAAADTAKPKAPSTTSAEPAPAAPSEPVDPEKKHKALAKKLRAAQALQDKAKAGETLLPEQKAKVDGIETIEKEMAALEIQK